jgi:hypothetical protein
MSCPEVTIPSHEDSTEQGRLNSIIGPWAMQGVPTYTTHWNKTVNGQ